MKVRPAPIGKKVGGVDEDGKPKQPAAIDRDDRRPVHLQRHPAREDAVLQLCAEAKGSSRVIGDCYAISGGPATIELLDNMKTLGFKRATLAGLSFGITDLGSAGKKPEILDEAQKRPTRSRRTIRSGAITEGAVQPDHRRLGPRPRSRSPTT